MHKDIQELLFDVDQISAKVKEIAKQLDAVYQDEEVILLGIMKGSMPFYTDLARSVHFPTFFDFMCVSSYGTSVHSSGELKITLDHGMNFENKNVLIVEDILDTGNTLFNLRQHLMEQNPKSLRICCFLDKPSRRLRDIEADFIGYTIPDAFVVGYGLDYAENYRSLPYIGILKPEIYENH